MTNKDEQYYRVDFETAKLLKQAGFNEETAGWYNRHGIYWEQQSENWNAYEKQYSAPLIDIALVWCTELGYYEDFANGMLYYKEECLNLILSEFGITTRDANLRLIQACCEHQIKLKNQ